MAIAHRGFWYTGRMFELSGKRILLGVSGSIAASKSPELVRCLRQAGAEVQVVMTAAAEAFVTPMILAALSGRRVRQALFDAEAEAAMGHIELARWADLVLVAPATANLMARLAQGLADDLLTTLCLATRAPLWLAPAMNSAMWTHPATVANRERLQDRGVRLLGPAVGDLACGETGPGRMLEPEALVAALAAGSTPPLLAGRRVMVTAGPTLEPLDPVRFLGNRSSGRMGFAIARAAAEAGARVVLVAGPVQLATPPGVERVDVETAREMYDAVMARIEEQDLFVATAAVADYRPAVVAPEKIKKSTDRLRLELVRNPDILAAVARRPRPPFTVGFAAETHDLARHARGKRLAKGVDMIAANRVGPGLGFGQEDNALQLFCEGGELALPRQPKETLAQALIREIARRMARRSGDVSDEELEDGKGTAQDSG